MADLEKKKILKPATEMKVADKLQTGKIYRDSNVPVHTDIPRHIDIPQHFDIPHHKDIPIHRDGPHYKDIPHYRDVPHHVDSHRDSIFKVGERFTVTFAKDVTFTKAQIVQLEAIGGKFTNNQLSVSADKAAELQKFVLNNKIETFSIDM